MIYRLSVASAALFNCLLIILPNVALSSFSRSLHCLATIEIGIYIFFCLSIASPYVTAFLFPARFLQFLSLHLLGSRQLDPNLKIL